MKPDLVRFNWQKDWIQQYRSWLSWEWLEIWNS